MKQPVFQKEDVVYHPTYGKGKVHKQSKSLNAEMHLYAVDFSSNGSSWCQEVHLSFQPWPAPCHTRPFMQGWYVLYRKGFGYKVMNIKNPPEESVQFLQKLIDEEKQ